MALLEINLDESNTKVDDDEVLLEHNSKQTKMMRKKGYLRKVKFGI